MKFLQPVDRILDQQRAHGSAVLPVEIDGRTPGGAVFGREVERTEGMEVRAIGAEVVVDHVEYHPEAMPMCRIDEAPEVVGTTVAACRCEQGGYVVSPVALPGEITDGHQLEG